MMDDRKRLADLARGMSLRAIAAEEGISHARVQARLARLDGYPEAKAAAERARFDPERSWRRLRRLAGKMPLAVAIRELARKDGVTEHAIRKRHRARLARLRRRVAERPNEPAAPNAAGRPSAPAARNAQEDPQAARDAA